MALEPMSNSTSLLLAVGGVFLVTWYGIRQLRVERQRRYPLPRQGTREYERVARSALAAEFQCSQEEHEFFPGGLVLCPDCGQEYPAGTPYCECGSETMEAEEAEDSQPASRLTAAPCEEEALICVYVAENTWKAFLLKSFLESHEISCMTKGNVPSGLHFHYLGAEEVRLMVPQEEAARARSLLQNC